MKGGGGDRLVFLMDTIDYFFQSTNEFFGSIIFLKVLTFEFAWNLEFDVKHNNELYSPKSLRAAQ
jgi:hypothetical protein